MLNFVSYKKHIWDANKIEKAMNVNLHGFIWTVVNNSPFGDDGFICQRLKEKEGLKYSGETVPFQHSDMTGNNFVVFWDIL